MRNQKKNDDIPFLEGKYIALRLLRQEDINERYLSWINDAEVTQYMETRFFPCSIGDLEGFYKGISKSKNDTMFAIIFKKDNVHIGNIKLGDINWIHRYGDLGIMIGDKKYWGKGCGKEAINLLLQHAFNKLNLNKVILGVYADHRSAIRLYRDVGFQIEGRLREMLYLDGKYTDKVYMGILASEFKKRKKVL